MRSLLRAAPSSAVALLRRVEAALRRPAKAGAAPCPVPADPWPLHSLLAFSGRSGVEYAVVFLLLCGGFAGFVASRKGRSAALWFVVGLIPILGVVLALSLAPARASRKRVARPEPRRGVKPKRCNGSFGPECWGCPHFRRPLFDPFYSGHRKGYCMLFGQVLAEQSRPSRPAHEDK